MKTDLKRHTASLTYNESVTKAYYEILKQTKAIIATYDQYELRCTLQRTEGTKPGFGVKVHEIVSPLFYLCLQYEVDTLYIHFGFEQLDVDFAYASFTSQFFRLLYKLTAAEHTAVAIESCICTDYIFTTCSELYESIDSSTFLNHQFKLIPFKAKPVKRNLKKVA